MGRKSRLSQAALVFGSPLFLILSFPPFDLGWLGWVALLPWLVSLDRRNPRQAFWLSYAVGLLFFAGTMGWILYVTVPGFILLVAYLALYFAVWGWFVHRVLPKFTILFTLPAAWVALEYLRCHLLTGLGWNLLAHTQWNWIGLIQIADLTGVTGVSFLIVLVNAALYRVVSRGSWVIGFRSARFFPLMTAGLLLLGSLVYGTTRLSQYSSATSLKAQDPTLAFRVAVLQGNIPQYEKWNEAFEEAIWDRYEALTSEGAKRKPDLVIWPETSVPDYFREEAESDAMARVRKVVRENRTMVLVGVPVLDEEGTRTYNSAVLFDSNGTVLDRHDKIHLVPFGEYVPLEPLLGWLREFVLMGDFDRGHRATVFRPTPIAPFGVLICFEDLFPGVSRRFVREGAQWLVVITNDAWFKRSAASVQHLQASVFRAVENRLWVARAANTGWSGFIDPAGRRLKAPQQIPRFAPGIAEARINVSSDWSGYVRWGDWFPVLCLMISVLDFGSRYRLIRV